MSTKQELLIKAKEYNITGRHDMTKEQLEQAIALRELGERAEKARINKDALKNVVRRYPSLGPRDSNNKIIRLGRNISGNKPFQFKYYYLDPKYANPDKWADTYKEAFNASPKQVQDILLCMADHVSSKMDPMIGAEIVDHAKNKGYLESKIDSDKLFAYYRKALEVLGVIHHKDWDPEQEHETMDEEEGEE